MCEWYNFDFIWTPPPSRTFSFPAQSDFLFWVGGNPNPDSVTSSVHIIPTLLLTFLHRHSLVVVVSFFLWKRPRHFLLIVMKSLFLVTWICQPLA